MDGHLVPINYFDHSFFDRQRTLFPHHVSKFYDNDLSKFDVELAKMKQDMFRFDSDPVLRVDQPFVEDISGNKKFSLTFDCSGYKPENIHIKTVDEKMVVNAKHEEKSPGRTVSREFTKTYSLPGHVDPLLLKSNLSRDGVLVIEGPAPKATTTRKQRLVPLDILMKM